MLLSILHVCKYIKPDSFFPLVMFAEIPAVFWFIITFCQSEYDPPDTLKNMNVTNIYDAAYMSLYKRNRALNTLTQLTALNPDKLHHYRPVNRTPQISVTEQAAGIKEKPKPLR